MRGRLLAVVTALLLPAALLLAWPADPAGATGCGQSGAQPGDFSNDKVPWQQQWLDPERVWPFATGTGQTVAVLDTGVDASAQPQLSGRVLAGKDLVGGGTDLNTDCTSHGTAVASLVAAKKWSTTGFHGLAPGASILPVRVGDADPTSKPNDPQMPTAAALASAITWAAGHGATVIDVSFALPEDDPALKAAVQRALADDIVVVAAVGDQHDDNYVVDPVTNYPAGYPGVVGVGAVDQTFARVGTSMVGDDVKLVAPGDEVLACTRETGYSQFSGTSVAAGIVAGAAALVREAWPRMSQAEVVRQLESTADPAAGGVSGPEFGNGVVDPYRAVTERITGGSPHRVAGVPAPHVDPRARAAQHWWSWTTTTALMVAGVIAFLVVLFVVAAAVVPRGQRRGWRVTRARPAATTLDEEPVTTPSDELFAVPKPHGD